MLSRLKRKRTQKEILAFLLRMVVAILFISPLLMGLSYAFRSDAEIMTTKGVTLLPRVWTLGYNWQSR